MKLEELHHLLRVALLLSLVYKFNELYMKVEELHHILQVTTILCKFFFVFVDFYLSIGGMYIGGLNNQH